MKNFLKTEIISDEAISVLFLIIALFSAFMMNISSIPFGLSITIIFNLLSLLYGIRVFRTNKVSGIILIAIGLLFLPFLSWGIPLLMVGLY